MTGNGSRLGAATGVAVLLLLGGSSAGAFGTPLTMVTVDNTNGGGGAPMNLLDLTIGGVTYVVADGDLALGTSSGGNCGGGFPPTNADDFNINSFASLCGAPDPEDTMQTILFNGQTLYSDMNGSLPDFFIIENGGNDDGEIRAILSDGTLGDPVSFVSGDFGDTGLNSSFNQDLKGLAFSITDLLDGGGNNLTLADEIRGFQLSNSTGVDPSSISAVIPEPGTAVLCGLGLAGLACLRRPRLGA